MQRYFLAFLAMSVLNLSAFAGDGPLVVPSNLKTVTVYSSGAELVHTSTVQLSAGSQELLIENISNAIPCLTSRVPRFEDRGHMFRGP